MEETEVDEFRYDLLWRPRSRPRRSWLTRPAGSHTPRSSGLPDKSVTVSGGKMLINLIYGYKEDLTFIDIRKDLVFILILFMSRS